MVRLIYFVNQKHKNLYRPFIDSIKLLVKGGHGGNGYPKYGGIGGQGGAIIFETTENATLKNVWKSFPEKQIRAANGEDSNKSRILGRRGADVRVPVPCGITIIDEKSKKSSELNELGEMCLIAGGGSGGNPTNQFIGQKGQEKRIKVELKLIADLGLVGFPNAGKSSFLKAISRAKPKIASYKFTTIQPQVGVIEFDDYRQISLADLPGLIEGAHKNVGLGHEFLRHVERCTVLILVVDIFGFQLSVNHQRRNCLENIYALNKELELYDKALLSKPTILLLNKLDIDGSLNEFEKYKDDFENLSKNLHTCPEELRPKELMKFENVLMMSAKNALGIDEIKCQIRKLLDSISEANQLIDSEDPSRAIDRKLKEFGPNII